ncbi:MAG: class I SAM-dependent methyltransferase [Sedimentisphaerales bacterium]|nr:class I SAM-dependent methyltransferase [Sedimentisphaerales bacterium]
MFKELEEINTRPEPFQYYTAEALWTDEHTSKQMLKYHLDESVDASSRNSEFIHRSVEWIASHFNVNSQTSIADFGCGPGLYATRLAKKGANVTGIDFSERSIRYAKETAAQKGFHINYVQQNYLEFDTNKRFDLIIMIMCDFCALSPAQRQTMVCKFHTLLKPGGSILLDVYSLAFFDQRKETATYEHNQLDGFWSPESYYGFLNTFKYEKEKVLLDKYTIVEKARTRIVYNWLQCFSRDAITAEFETNGLKIEEVYSDVAGTPFESDAQEFAIVAKK